MLFPQFTWTDVRKLSQDTDTDDTAWRVRLITWKIVHISPLTSLPFARFRLAETGDRPL